MYLINYVNVIVCDQVSSSPPSVFRIVRFTFCPVDHIISLNHLVSSCSLPETFPLPYVYITPQTNPFVHHSIITLSLHHVKSEIFKLSLNKPTILLTVRCVPY